MTSKYMQSHENTISSGMSEKGHFGTSHFVLHGEGVLFQRLANEHLNREGRGCLHAVKPLIKDNPKEDKPPNKGQAESTPVHTLYKITSERSIDLCREVNLSTKDKTAGPEGVLIKRFHCSPLSEVALYCVIHTTRFTFHSTCCQFCFACT